MPNSRIAYFSGWFVIAIAILLGVATIYGFVRYTTFHSRIEQLKADGELVSIDDLIHTVENEQNDARFYLNKIIDAEFAWWEIIPRDDDGNVMTNSESLKLFENFETENPDYFENIRLAVAASDMSSFPYFETDCDFAIGISGIVHILDWKAKTLIAKNDGIGACDTAIEMLVLAQKNQNHVSYLDALADAAIREDAYRVLASAANKNLLSNVDEVKIKRINNLLDGIDSLAKFVELIKTERSFAIFQITNSTNYLYDEESGYRQNGLAWLASKLSMGNVALSGNGLLDQTDEILEICKEPLAIAMGGDFRGAQLHIRQLHDIRHLFGDDFARSHALRILLALQTDLDSAERDSWSPEYLQSIGVPAESTTDPYTGNPMTIKRIDNKWQVYSFGRDRKDNGGDIEHDLGFGLHEFSD